MAHLVGFDLLQPFPHEQWFDLLINGAEDITLQGHRGSYKTTCISVTLAILMITNPNESIMFMRKTDDDVVEIVSQVRNILSNDGVQEIIKKMYGSYLSFAKDTSSELTTSLRNTTKGTSQLLGIGTKASLTGKHFDTIFTDDIVNVKDRISRAERERTKLIYQELQNIKNRGGRIVNTGTPWHKDDAFSIMPKPIKFDCYSTGLIAPEQLEKIRNSMTPSLFAANYELKHIASDDVIFTSPKTGADISKVEQGDCHIDAAYGGEDYTAFTICRKSEGKYYILGKLWRKHVDNCIPEIIRIKNSLNAGKIWCENNGDKGYLVKDLKKRGERAVSYHENMNKFLKITTYLKSVWNDVVFVEGTDIEYIDQICDYNENAEHDDAPDSAASMVRKFWHKKDRKGDDNVW